MKEKMRENYLKNFRIFLFKFIREKKIGLNFQGTEFLTCLNNISKYLI